MTTCISLLTLATFSFAGTARAESLLANLKAPNAEWQVEKKSDEVEVSLKSKPQAVNVSIKIMDDVPISSDRFLEEVRSQLLQKPEYQSGKMSPVESKPMEGKTWSAFSIRRRDEIYQDFWARKLGAGKVLMVLFTAVGDYHAQYHPAFLTVLKQATQDPG